MLMSDFEFVLPNFNFWALGRAQMEKGPGHRAGDPQNEGYPNIVMSMLISDFEFVLPNFDF